MTDIDDMIQQVASGEDPDNVLGETVSSVQEQDRIALIPDSYVSMQDMGEVVDRLKTKLPNGDQVSLLTAVPKLDRSPAEAGIELPASMQGEVERQLDNIVAGFEYSFSRIESHSRRTEAHSRLSKFLQEQGQRTLDDFQVGDDVQVVDPEPVNSDDPQVQVDQGETGVVQDIERDRGQILVSMDKPGGVKRELLFYPDEIAATDFSMS